MPRTSEQIAADDALTVAIERVIAAYSLNDGGVLSDYVVIYGMSRLDEAGERESKVGGVLRDNYCPTWVIRGLLAEADTLYTDCGHDDP